MPGWSCTVSAGIVVAERAALAQLRVGVHLDQRVGDLLDRFLGDGRSLDICERGVAAHGRMWLFN
jgi:hypothetical protein